MDKQQRAKIAKQQVDYHNNKYGSLIKKCIDLSTIYEDNIDRVITENIPKTSFLNLDSVSGAILSSSGKTTILNFASYTSPGGGFINGAIAQEEYLCHNSFLYNILSSFDDFYEYNKLHKNNSLYENRAIYTPNVLFNETYLFDVLTCAAPNKTAALDKSISIKENDLQLKSRIDFILKILEDQKVNTFICGAFGCGVFGQDPAIVSSVFKDTIKNTTINNIVFCVPGDNKNSNVFKSEFS